MCCERNCNIQLPHPTSSKQAYTYVGKEGAPTAAQEELLTEYGLHVYANGRFLMTLVCTPEAIEDLVLGRLYTDGFVQSLDEVISLTIQEESFQVQVELKDFSEEMSDHKEQFVDTDNMGFRLACLQRKPVPLQAGTFVLPEWIYSIAAVFEQDTVLHQKTYGTHSCFLGRKGEVLFSCEDIGRHNAIDKVIGRALRSGIDLTETILFTSGRIPLDMVEKVIRAKIPVFVTKAKPTIQSVECAAQYGLTLIGSATHRGYKIYTSSGNIGGIE